MPAADLHDVLPVKADCPLWTIYALAQIAEDEGLSLAALIGDLASEYARTCGYSPENVADLKTQVMAD